MRYYFDIFTGDHWARDDRGWDCASDGAARRHALLALTELAYELLLLDGQSTEMAIRVRLGQQPAFIFQLTFERFLDPSPIDSQ
jgi:hypothetical protein